MTRPDRDPGDARAPADRALPGNGPAAGPPLPTARELPRATPLPHGGPATPATSSRNKSPFGAESRSQDPAARVNKSARIAIVADEHVPLQGEPLAETAIKTAPAWLVSFVVHTLLIIALALFYIAKDLPSTIALDATFAETLGQQLDNEILQSDALDPVDVDVPAFSPDLDPVDDPLARPPDIDLQLTGSTANDPLAAPQIGLALTGRERGMKEALLVRYGGTATTEAAVQRALEWLKRNQRRDGAWSLKGPYANGAFSENKTAATAMALLAFQGAGQTHETGMHHEHVRRGWRALLKMQDQDGNFFTGGEEEHRLYSQAQATIAVCEIYGMTQASMFRGPAQKAIDYAVQVQAKEGGWRYRPGTGSDTSVTGWFVMALQSALMGGLDVPQATLDRVSAYLDRAAEHEGSFYAYQPERRRGFTPAMTAEGLLCRQYLGWNQNDPRLLEGAAYLLENKINWNERDVYYWYYATQVLHHLEGEYWERWNRVMRQKVPENQVMAGTERGSWDPSGDRWGANGGRLYTTCLSAYMLEVYYRHLPIYSYRLK